VGWFSIINRSGPEIALLGWFKGWIRPALGMIGLENGVIMALVVLSIGFQWFFLRIYARILNNSMVLLDSKLAEAIQASIKNLPEALGQSLDGIEPPNPVQQIIAQFIQQKLNPTLEVKEIERGSDGKFT
jgi:hypothetical protein